MLKIWVNAGELSGDIQAAEFVKELKKLDSDLDIVGMGGDNLACAGMRCLYHVNELSVMGVTEVLSALPRIIGLLRRIKKSLEQEAPSAVVVTDAPDFNFFVVRMARKLGIPVYYFIPPKVWAWRSGRIGFLRKNIRKIYSILPFEVDFYRQHGINVEYIGNPLVDLVDYGSISTILPQKGRIGLMPGSRKKEIESLMPEFSLTATRLQEQFPYLEYHLIRAPRFSEEYLRSLWQSSAPLHIQEPDNRYAFMRSCECLLVASGTAVLESALAGVPSLVSYKVNAFSYAIGKRLVKVKWISLPNLIMNEEIFPEFIQEDASAEKISQTMCRWLENHDFFEKMQADCARLRERCGKGQGAARFAASIYNDLKSI